MLKKVTMLFGSLMALYALEACVVVSSVDCSKTPTDPTCTGNGGSGGNGTGGDTTSSSSSSSSGKGGGGGGTAGAGGSACVGCASFASDGMGTLCDASKPIYDAARACTCDQAAADPMPGCKDVCGDNRCMGMASSPECDKCLLQGPCAADTAACANDG